MEAEERRKLLNQLHTSEARLLELVDGLTPAQWTFREDATRWSIAENFEHVIVVERAIDTLVRSVLEAKADLPPAEKQTKQERARSLEPVVFRIAEPTGTRVEANERLLPRGRWEHPAEMLAVFRKLRAKSVQFATEIDAPLRDYFYPHQALGDLDCYQWLVVLSLHGARHAAQMERVLAHPDFPLKADANAS